MTKDKDSDTVEIKLQQVPLDLCKEILSHATEIDQEESKSTKKDTFKEKAEKPSFSARPDTKSPQFDFKRELEQLPFELNIGEAPLTHEQQAHLIDIIYNHTEVFSLFDGDLGFCDALSIVYQQQWINQYIYHTSKYTSSYNAKSGNVLTTGSNRASSVCQKVRMHPRWS